MNIDKILIEEKLSSLYKCLNRIKINTPDSAEKLKSDIDKQDIINLNFQRAIQISIDIASHILSGGFSETAKTMTEVFGKLHEKKVIDDDTAYSLAKAVGFRNIAAHEYNTIDMDILYAIATKNISIFYEFGETVLKLIM